MALLKLLLLLQLELMLLALVVSSSSPTVNGAYYDPGYSKPGCVNKCGSLSIPYPFGMDDPRCYLSELFLISCNRSVTSQPKAFLGNGNIPVTDIELDEGQVRIELRGAKDCYENGSQSKYWSPYLRFLSNGIYSISNAKNKLIAIGCDTYVIVKGRRQGQNYTLGCTSACSSADQIENGSCTGVGCCQTDIPRGLDFIDINLNSYYNHTYVEGFNPCSYSAIIEQDKFNFSLNSFQEWRRAEEHPMLIDWAIPLLNHTTCKAVQQNRSGYACGGNATCFVPERSSGYRCKCLDGYRGNPYLPRGCRDIDECREATDNCVSGGCRNTMGNYTCFCPKGKHGDGRINGTGCNGDPFPLIPVTLGGGAGVVTLIVAGFWLYFGRKERRMMKLKRRFFEQNGGLMLQQQLSKQTGTSNDATKIFTAEELDRATNYYEESRMIGRGGFGTVYKGTLTDDRVVAIKKSKIVDGSQSEQFINEVVILMKINHRNVVKLLGCCLETEVPLLVYEYVSNGTLYDHIHNRTEAIPSLSWEARLRIATETAGVLSYLHFAASTPIIHRDIKSANILLDDECHAKVSDFGASKLVPMDQNQLSTLVQGTLGYIDPEYFHTSQLTDRSDVYSFGVVLVELFTGKKALSWERPETERCLAAHFLLYLKEDRLIEIVDGQILNKENLEQIEEVARLAKRCLRVKGEERPSMKEVATELEGMRKTVKHPSIDNELDSQEAEHLAGGKPETGNNGSMGSGSVGFDSTSGVQMRQLGGGR